MRILLDCHANINFDAGLVVMVNNLVNRFSRSPISCGQRVVILAVVPALLSLFSNLAFCNGAMSADTTRDEVRRVKTGDETLTDIFHRKFLLDTENKRLARAVTIFDVQAPAAACREVLSDFPKFPEFMKRVKSVEVVKREGNMYFTQSYLKPQLMVTQPLNHTITDVYSKPNTIEWVLVDGNFPSASGRWEIVPTTKHTCRVTYTVAVEPGPFVPSNFVSFGLKLVQKEVINGMKERVEEYARHEAALGEQDEPHKTPKSKVSHLVRDPA